MDSISDVKAQLGDMMQAMRVAKGELYFLEDEAPNDYSAAVKDRDTDMFSFLVGYRIPPTESAQSRCSVRCVRCRDAIVICRVGVMVGESFYFNSPDRRAYFKRTLEEMVG